MHCDTDLFFHNLDRTAALKEVTCHPQIRSGDFILPINFDLFWCISNTDDNVIRTLTHCRRNHALTKPNLKIQASVQFDLRSRMFEGIDYLERSLPSYLAQVYLILRPLRPLSKSITSAILTFARLIELYLIHFTNM